MLLSGIKDMHGRTYLQQMLSLGTRQAPLLPIWEIQRSNYTTFLSCFFLLVPPLTVVCSYSKDLEFSRFVTATYRYASSQPAGMSLARCPLEGIGEMEPPTSYSFRIFGQCCGVFWAKHWYFPKPNHFFFVPKPNQQLNLSNIIPQSLSVCKILPVCKGTKDKSCT